MRRLLALTMLAGAASLAAQEPSAAVTPDTSWIAPGDAVRITADSLGLKDWHGHYVAALPDSVVVRGADGAERRIPLWQINEFLVNHGNRPPQGQAGMGAVIGGLAGAGIGVLVGTHGDNSGCVAEGATILDCTSDQYKDGAIGLGIGLLVGAGVGALIRITPWQYVPIIPPPEVATRLTPRGDPALVLAFRF
ncbi:MAG TPA: hypothetical protein VMT93_04730 [Gemmatimonadaceae bacterium]|nr:hypothetical protein [Gemmatimonadaceae bacterium]